MIFPGEEKFFSGVYGSVQQRGDGGVGVRRRIGMKRIEQEKAFCAAYMDSGDPALAARAAEAADGFAMLRRGSVRQRLEKMRDAAAGELRREDVIRRLARLAFGRANDAVRLALQPGETDPDALDLSAVSVILVSDKGGVEVKLVDRVKALETLCGLLEAGGNGEAEELYQALGAAAGALDWGNENAVLS